MKEWCQSNHESVAEFAEEFYRESARFFTHELDGTTVTRITPMVVVVVHGSSSKNLLVRFLPSSERESSRPALYSRDEERVTSDEASATDYLKAVFSNVMVSRQLVFAFALCAKRCEPRSCRLLVRKKP